MFVAHRLAVRMAVAARTALKIAGRLVAPMVVAVTTALISFKNIDLVADYRRKTSSF